MACTLLILIPPAITRVLFFIPWFGSFTKTLNGSFIIAELVLLALLFNKRRSKEQQKPYGIALLLFILLQGALTFAGYWPWWKAIINAYAVL